MKYLFLFLTMISTAEADELNFDFGKAHVNIDGQKKVVYVSLKYDGATATACTIQAIFKKGDEILSITEQPYTQLRNHEKRALIFTTWDSIKGYDFLDFDVLDCRPIR